MTIIIFFAEERGKKQLRLLCFYIETANDLMIIDALLECVCDAVSLHACLVLKFLLANCIWMQKLQEQRNSICCY